MDKNKKYMVKTQIDCVSTIDTTSEKEAENQFKAFLEVVVKELEKQFTSTKFSATHWVISEELPEEN